MKKLALPLAALLFLGISSFGSAQSTAPTSKTADQLLDDSVKLMRQDLRSTKKQLVAANMTLTDAEATKFWPVYDQYTAAVAKLGDARYALIKEYADNYGTMTDAQASDLLARSLKSDADMANLRIQWIPQFEKVISPKKTAMFFQIDRRAGLVIDLQLASQIPLMNP